MSLYESLSITEVVKKRQRDPLKVTVHELRCAKPSQKASYYMGTRAARYFSYENCHNNIIRAEISVA